MSMGFMPEINSCYAIADFSMTTWQRFIDYANSATFLSVTLKLLINYCIDLPFYCDIIRNCSGELYREVSPLMLASSLIDCLNSRQHNVLIMNSLQLQRKN